MATDEPIPSPQASEASVAPTPPAGATAALSTQLQLLLESTGEGIFGVDMGGQCTFINPAGGQMLGWRCEQVLGQNMHCLIHHTHADGRHYPESECPIFNAFREGLPCRIDSEVLWRADGSAFAAEYSSHPIIDAGQVQGAVVTLVDITERKRGSPRSSATRCRATANARRCTTIRSTTGYATTCSTSSWPVPGTCRTAARRCSRRPSSRGLAPEPSPHSAQIIELKGRVA